MYAVITIVVIFLKIVSSELDYRLPKTVFPINYKLDVTLDDSVFETNTFSAVLKITLNCSDEASEIKLHSRNISITDLKLTEIGHELDIALKQPDLDEITDILTIPIEGHLLSPNNTYRLQFEYQGYLREDLNGVYKSSYQDQKGEEKFIIATNLYPDFARSAFPCFDEPSFKATFDLSIVHSLTNEAFTNTKRDKTEFPRMKLRTIFETSPKMPPYAISLQVSELKCRDVSYMNGNLPYHLCSKNPADDDLGFVSDIATKIIEGIENFTGVYYSVSGIKKLDQIAYPVFRNNIPGSLGFVSENEEEIFWNVAEISETEKLDIEFLLTHQFAYMWFGNLVTPQWWSDMFLSEGFASYLENRVISQIEPKWNLDKLFVIKKLQKALTLEYKAKTTSLATPVITPSEIPKTFQELSRTKGASILRMIEHMMTTKNFTYGVRTYLNNNLFANVKPVDLWNSFKTSIWNLPKTLSFDEVVKNWIEKPGFPLLKVSLIDNTKIRISQESFFEDSTKWYVPISYTVTSDEDTSPRVWLIPEEDFVEFDLPDNATWIVINNLQTGYYRIEYDDTLWNRLEGALSKPDFDGIVDVNRAAIVDDFFNLAKSNRKSYGRILKFIEYLENEASYYPWYSASGYLEEMYAKTVDRDLKSKLTQEFLRLMRKQHQNISFVIDESQGEPIDVSRQVLALTWACRLGIDDCIHGAIAAFNEYKTNNKKVDVNLKKLVYCVALGNSTNPEDDWGFLLSKYEQSVVASEKLQLLEALGCVKNETLLIQYLDKIVNGGFETKFQNALTAYSSVYRNNPDGLDVALNYILENHKRITRLDLCLVLEEIALNINHEEQLAKLELLSEDDSLDERVKESLISALESGYATLEWNKRLEGELREALVPSTTETISSTTSSKETPASSSTSSPTSSENTSSTSSSDSPEPTTESSGSRFRCYQLLMLLISFVIL